MLRSICPFDFADIEFKAKESSIQQGVFHLFDILNKAPTLIIEKRTDGRNACLEGQPLHAVVRVLHDSANGGAISAVPAHFHGLRKHSDNSKQCDRGNRHREGHFDEGESSNLGETFASIHGR